MDEADVLVIGAGPAGATAALNLAPSHRVVGIDRLSAPPERIGESLPPAARRLLADMGLLRSFLREGHAPYHGNRSVWGSDAPETTDFVRDPDGHGWHLDRARFERWLRAKAVERGAGIVAPARARGIARDGAGWCVSIDEPSGRRTLRASVVLYATGRAQRVARQLGATRRSNDRLLCGWIRGRGSGGNGFTYVEAERCGWWYTAPLPNRQRVVAFHTDADLPAARCVREPAQIEERARQLPGLRSVLEEADFDAKAHEGGVTAASGAALEPVSGDGWLAVGDAALSLDPLSSQGLLNALFTGLAAAEACARHLDGVEQALPGYAEAVAGIRAAHERHRALAYGAELRWPGAPFWTRRQTGGAPSPA